jgi:hypothetical protein
MESLPSSETGQEVAVRNDLVQVGHIRETPQWIIMGIEVPTGGVAVLASCTLTRAQMRRSFEDYTKKTKLGLLHLRKEHNAILIECEGFTFIHGTTYRECMLSLPDVWTPPEPEQKAIEQV